MKNKYTLNESERERILNLHEQQKPGIINRVKGAIQGFKNPTTPPVAATTAPVAATTAPVAATTAPATTTTTPPVAATTAPAVNTTWATSTDNSTICQTKPSKTMVPQVQQIQAAINKVFGPKPESKTIKDCKGGLLFPLKEDGLYGANTAKAILIAINYKKMGGGQPVAATTAPVAATTAPVAATTAPVAATTTQTVATPGGVAGNSLTL